MGRCALLPAIGDPLLTKLWLRQYEKCVRDHIDALYVVVNSELPQNVMDFSVSLFANDDKVKLWRYPRMISHGKALREIFDKSTEELVLLIEDDCFVFNRDTVD